MVLVLEQILLNLRTRREDKWRIVVKVLSNTEILLLNYGIKPPMIIAKMQLIQVIHSTLLNF